jgi:hypothetical protein
LGVELPQRDLRVSGAHAMHLDGMLVPAECLINGASVIRGEPPEQVAYFHLELDSHDVILAEGAPTESYIDLDNRNLFQNAADYVAPATMNAPPVEFAPRIESGASLAALRARLAERAAELGFVAPAAHRIALTAGFTQAMVPPGASVVLLCSTAARPPGDPRRLGAYVTSLRLDGAAIDLADPRLTGGFHAVEHQGAQRIRWTNGEGMIVLPPAARGRLLEIGVALLLGDPLAEQAA